MFFVISISYFKTNISALKAFQFVIESFTESRDFLRNAVPYMIESVTKILKSDDEEFSEAAIQVFVNVAGNSIILNLS